MATMTFTEAQQILSTVYGAMAEGSHRHCPVSALKGYDLFQIHTALKLDVANAFLIWFSRPDFEEKFASLIKHHEEGPPLIQMRVVPDDQVDIIGPKMIFCQLDPLTMKYKEPWASQETITSFGEFCIGVGVEDPLYWQKIYTRLGLEYLPNSPRGNQPEFLT